MQAQIITIGEELLIGQVVDTNSAWIAAKLNEIGVRIRQITSITDEADDIIRALNEIPADVQFVFITGGLGPTKDDITKKALARFFQAEMVFHEPTWEWIQKIMQKFGRPATDAHYRQCYMPSNAILLANRMGSAPAMWFEEDGRVYVSMPGVPFEMKHLIEQQVLPKLNESFSMPVILHRTILTVGEGESRLAERIEAFEDSLPPNIKLAYLPGLGQVRLRLSARGENRQTLNRELDEKVKEVVAIIPEFVFGYDGQSLEQAIGLMLRERNLTLATAESCTGGFLAHKITSVPGSSDYFKGSIVAYSNEVKIGQLGVSTSTLEQHGAVSEPIVKQMVSGIIRHLGAEIGLATSGIAGPGGGTSQKPVGTIWIAAGNEQTVLTQKLQLSKDRLINIKLTTTFALNLVRKFLLQED